MEQSFKLRSGKKQFTVAFTDKDHFEGVINNNPFKLDIVETNTGFHVLKDGLGYNIDVLKIDYEAKTVLMRINHKRYTYDMHDQFDELLHKLGMDLSAGNKIAMVKAPMPGLVLEVMVKQGDAVAVNQPLLILEAMKMENVIKSPAEGTVMRVGISKGSSVEKNQVLIEFN